MFKKATSISIVTALMIASAHAATLTNVEGAVSINRGDGYVPVVNGATVGPGDRVRTLKGSVNVVYENGCPVKVGPHEVVLVQAAAPGCTPAGGLKDGFVAPAPELGPWFGVGVAVAFGAGVGAAIASTTTSQVSP
jgi:hypothetical protein